MSSIEQRMAADEQSIDLGALAATLRRGWWIMALTTFIALVLCVIVLRNATYRHTATMVLAPAQTSSGDGLAARLGSLGGLASAVGVSLPDSGGSSAFRLYVEGLKSYDAAKMLAADPALMHRLFETEWNPVTRRWVQPQSFLTGLARGTKNLLGIPDTPWRAPDAARLQALMDEQVGVEVNPRSPVISVHFDHADPEFGKQFLRRLAASVDDMLRQRALLRTQDYIAYLTAKLPTVELAEQRLSITQTLGEQERVRMAASSTRPFAADVFSGPSASPRPTSPRPLKLLLVSMLAGLVLGAAIVLVRARRRQVPAAAEA